MWKPTGGWWKKEKDDKLYRLSLVENSTHKSIKSFRFTKTAFILYAVTAMVSVVLIIYCLIAFTPLRTTIPGYPDAHSKRVALANAIKIDSLESSITRWELYAGNLSRVLGGEEAVSMDSIVKGGINKYLSDKTQQELSRQDSLLRLDIQKEEQFDVGNAKQRILPIEGMHFFSPLKGAISNGYDAVLHPAVDITAPAKSVVSAAMDGTVISAGWNETSGHTTCIQHPGNVVTIYMHNEKLLKKVGDKVTAGTPIALVGSSGSLTTGNHLHFEIWYNGESVDPTKYISF